jgi:biotin transport system substrate-specific component
MKSRTKQLGLSSLLDSVKESQIFWILSFSVLTAIAAQITIPVKPVPFTLQTMIVILAGAFLGARNGAYSQIIYLLVGATGLPVFAHTPDAGIGLTRLIGPTGGYLLAFPLAAFVVGYLVEKNKKYLPVVLSMFLGAVIILACGTLYLNLVYLHDFSAAIKAGAAIFSIWTVIKVFVAAAIYFAVTKNRNK